MLISCLKLSVFFFFANCCEFDLILLKSIQNQSKFQNISYEKNPGFEIWNPSNDQLYQKRRREVGASSRDLRMPRKRWWRKSRQVCAVVRASSPESLLSLHDAYILLHLALLHSSASYTKDDQKVDGSPMASAGKARWMCCRPTRLLLAHGTRGRPKDEHTVSCSLLVAQSIDCGERIKIFIYLF